MLMMVVVLELARLRVAPCFRGKFYEMLIYEVRWGREDETGAEGGKIRGKRAGKGCCSTGSGDQTVRMAAPSIFRASSFGR